MSTTTISHDSACVMSFSEWLAYFDHKAVVTASELERFRTEAGGNRYPEMVLRLARAGKLRPKVLADAAYDAWLKIENPKTAMCSSEWTDLFRRAYLPSHALFEVPDLS